MEAWKKLRVIKAHVKAAWRKAHYASVAIVVLLFVPRAAWAVNSYVGIGTTSPTFPLHVMSSGPAVIWDESTAAATTASGYVGIKTNSGAGGNYWRGFAGYDQTGANHWMVGQYGAPEDTLVFYTGSPTTERMRITSSGAIGIGTTSPSYPLSVQNQSGKRQNTTLSTSDYSPATSTGSCLQITFPGLTGNTYTAVSSLISGGTAVGNLVFQPGGGNIGIGTTSPAYTLDVNGTVHAQAGYETQPGNNAAANGHVFNLSWTGAVTQLWIDYSNIGNITVSSDRRLKNNIQPLPHNSGIAALERLNPVSFYWNDKESGTERQFGFIAQEVREIFPNLVKNGLKTEAAPDGLLRIEHNGLFAPIVKAIQELKALFDTDHAAIVALKAENARLKEENVSIKAYLCDKDPDAAFCQ